MANPQSADLVKFQDGNILRRSGIYNKHVSDHSIMIEVLANSRIPLDC